MAEAPTVKLTEDGRPAGFLDCPEVFETVRYEVVEDGIGLLTLDRPTSSTPSTSR